jgi:hypothetical protein
LIDVSTLTRATLALDWGAGLLAIAIVFKVDEEVRGLNASIFASRQVLYGSLNAIAICTSVQRW